MEIITVLRECCQDHQNANLKCFTFGLIYVKAGDKSLKNHLRLTKNTDKRSKQNFVCVYEICWLVKISYP